MIDEPVDSYLKLRDSLIESRPAGAGRAISEKLCEALDSSIESMWPEPPVTLVAMGSYGRREMCFYSDIDLMILHDGDAGKEAVEAVFYPLWNSGLKVGHSLRTVSEALVVARDNFETLSALMSARLVAGDGKRLAELEEALAVHVQKNPIKDHLISEERRRRDQAPWPLLQLDLKTGRSGLRTAQAIQWDRELSGSDHDPEPLRTAVDLLIGARNGIHATNRRALDSLVLDVRTQTAAWLGVSTKELVNKVQLAIRTIERDARRQWPELASAPTKPSLRDRFNRRPPPKQHLTTIAAAAQAAADGRFLNEKELERARMETGHWSGPQVEYLLNVIAQPELGWQIFDQLVEVGWVERSMQTFVHTVGLGQLAPFHEHPVDTHLWRTAAETKAVIGSESDDRLAQELAVDLDASQLLLIAWLHDIGKGYPGDHSQRGARIGAKLAARLRLDRESTNRLVQAIDLHLLLANTAMRRDTSDPDVISAVADQVKDRNLLKILYILTAADSRATGSNMWNEWRASQVRALYHRVDEHMRGAVVDEHAESRYEQWFTKAEQAAHADLMPVNAGEVRMYLTDSAPLYQLTVVARDRPGLLSAITGALTLNNLAIQGARLSTNDEGVAIDVFRVSSTLRVDEISQETVDRARTDLEAALDNRIDIEELLQTKAGHYQLEADAGIDNQVTVEEAGSTVVEIKTADRFGLLHDLCRAITDTGLDIHLAKIDTRGTQAVDVFYLTEIDGSSVTPDNVIALTERLAEVL